MIHQQPLQNDFWRKVLIPTPPWRGEIMVDFVSLYLEEIFLISKIMTYMFIFLLHYSGA